jgi:hypothetical protein
MPRVARADVGGELQHAESGIRTITSLNTRHETIVTVPNTRDIMIKWLKIHPNKILRKQNNL